ncbi:hypothetical protein [Terricaulis sp.]|uniref:hypothetical protein n=1 Tax=Terricaulis sp. TaxID=2768686 RepID=UPI002AC6EB9E|nr:hypothetical protein [Terricaulis sp.]MDZ4692009.1 hypothetical protein [Terricaulis sp.]
MAVHIPSHLRERFDALERMPAASGLPAPWIGPIVIAVGGLTDVGYGDSSDLLICVSSNGRSVIDCLAGGKVARDDGNDFTFDAGNLLVGGLGPLADKQIRTAGLAGGGLPSATKDGWSVQRHPFAFPDEQVFVAPPGQAMLWTPRGEEMNLTKLGGFITEIRTFGFSPTGLSFVVATSSDVIIFSRT